MNPVPAERSPSPLPAGPASEMPMLGPSDQAEEKAAEAPAWLEWGGA